MSRVSRLGVLGMLGVLLAACGENLPEPVSGTIEVNSVTAGDPADPDGYTLRVDADGGRPLGTNSTLQVSDLSIGSHDLALEGIASNCLLTGPNPRTVSVSSGDAARATFELECGATGSIEITTATSGESVDTDGYLATLDAASGRPIDSNGAITIAAVSSGDHVLRLTGIAPNCAASENPRTVTVADDPVPAQFDIICGPPVGTIFISTVTGGLTPDPDGYAVSVDGGDPRTIDPNGSLSVSGIPTGDHTVGLSGIASNCAVAGENPLTVTVTNGGGVSARFQVGCLLGGIGRVLFASDRSGTSHLYSVKPNGSGLVDLTPSSAAYDADWSPDGSRIVFFTGSSIALMNADGSNVVRLGVSGLAPKWSPDGSKIAFESGGSVRVMKANGSQTVTLAAGHRPDWSPDGSRILFDQIDRNDCVFDLCLPNLYVMTAEGTDVTRLTPGAKCGAWSPDGSSIASVSIFSGVYVTKADGTGGHLLASGVPDASSGCPVVWSPDGSAIAYAAGLPDGTSEVVIVPARGGPGAVLATSPGSEFPESWK